MWLVFVVAALAAFGVCAVGLASLASDIQIIIAIIGFFSGIILLGIAQIIVRLDRARIYLRNIEDEVYARDE